MTVDHLLVDFSENINMGTATHLSVVLRDTKLANLLQKSENISW
jgi:hypothetical protein